MLFMGSEKYPEEDSFDKFISDHSGSSNAFTEDLSTNYYFSINNENLREGIDRFAQFFLKPLMK